MPLFHAQRTDLRRLLVAGAVAVASLAMASSAQALDFDLHTDIQGAGKVAEVSAPANTCESSLATPTGDLGSSCAFRHSFGSSTTS
jgi:hypothetical protein